MFRQYVCDLLQVNSLIEALSAPVIDYGRCACTIFMADAISVETSVILLGTTRVVLALAATREYASTAFSATLSCTASAPPG